MSALNLQTKTDLEHKLWRLEVMGYHLYFDEKLNEWECFRSEDDRYWCKGENKIKVIEQAFETLMQLK